MSVPFSERRIIAISIALRTGRPVVRRRKSVCHAVPPLSRTRPFAKSRPQPAGTTPCLDLSLPTQGGSQLRCAQERFATRSACCSEVGTTPRERGAVHDKPWQTGPRRAIPPGAGSSFRCVRSTSTVGAIPARGEQAAHVSKGCRASEPSPQARGAEDHGDDQEERDGTIPAGAGEQYGPAGPRAGRAGTILAGAGSSREPRTVTLRSGDHPRRCGEQRRLSGVDGDGPGPSLRTWGAAASLYVGINGIQGPSPRVRGAGKPTRRAWPQPGTIPAGAGSRSGSCGRTGSPQDHPRGTHGSGTGTDTRDTSHHGIADV